MTLLLGPPSGGKSVLLQALSGRLQSGRNLRVSGCWHCLKACLDAVPSVPLRKLYTCRQVLRSALLLVCKLVSRPVP